MTSWGGEGLDPHLYSSSHQDWSQSQHCRCTESFLPCSHNGHCDTWFRLRYTHQCLKQWTLGEDVNILLHACESLPYKVSTVLWNVGEFFTVTYGCILHVIPMQACLVGVPWYPSWHLQWYEPGVLTQSPFTQGLLLHSSTSTRERGEQSLITWKAYRWQQRRGEERREGKRLRFTSGLITPSHYFPLTACLQVRDIH